MALPNPQMLLLEPKDELRFYAPFNLKNTCALQVTNPTPYSIYYKIKTTASFRYYVTPKMGLLMPYSQQAITIGMKAPKGDTEDKFKLIAIVSPSTGENPADTWEKVDESLAMTSKLTVVFVEDELHDEPAAPQHMIANGPSELIVAHSNVKSFIPSVAKMIAFITIGLVAVASSFYSYRTGAKII